MQKSLTALLISSSSFFLNLQAVQASTGPIMSDQEQVTQATRICAVRVIGTQTVAPSGDSKTVMTRASLSPIQCFKDATTEKFDIEYPGGITQVKMPNGEILPISTSVPGAPHLIADQAYVLLLWKSKPEAPFLIQDWAQGILPITYDATIKDYRLITRDKMTLKAYSAELRQQLQSKKNR